MTDPALPSDPLNDMPDVAPEGATEEQRAVAAYQAVGAMLAALRTQADETKAKNYVAIAFEGFKLPFDRAELHMMRPGGLSPVQRAEAQQVIIDGNIRDAQVAHATIEHLAAERDRLAVANAEIAVELADRITGNPVIDTEERFLSVVRAMEATIQQVREAHRATETRGMLVLGALKNARDVLATHVLGHPDFDETKQALDDVNDVLAKLGISL